MTWWRFRMGRAVPAGLLAALVWTAPGFGQIQAQKLGVFSDWEAYAYTEGKGKVCYALARPKSSEPKDVRRGDVYLTVTHRTVSKTRDEVSLNFGYPLKVDSTVEAALGTEKFALFTKDEGAWTPDPKVDKALVEAMAKGANLMVKGVSTRGTTTTDNYSLIGFSAALKAIGAACSS